ncbi:MAG: histidine kinase [Colwellia sp.]|nr:histidine kinase [Colwellia sp.]
MVKRLIPEHLRKDWLLHLSGFVTWLVVSVLSLNGLEPDLSYFLKVTGFIGFYALFAWVVSSERATHIVRNKICVACQIMLILPLIHVDKYRVAAILLVLVATQLPAIMKRKQALLLISFISIMHFILVFNGAFVNTFFHVLIYFMLQIFGYSTLEIMLREERAKEELATINQELLATRFMLKNSSQKQERLRISRDLHDVIGHQLTALSLNLEVASHKVPDEFKPLLQDNLLLAKTLLSDVRHVVKEMRDEEQFDLAINLSNLVTQLPDCKLIIESPLVIDSLRLKQQLMFCLQEGISNALRHGKASKLILTNEKVGDSLVIELIDNGVGLPKNKQGEFGSGLKGMEERLADFNGTVELIDNSSNCPGSTLKLKVEDCYD